MSTSIPRVSIGLPIYNGENFLEETLNSLLAQTFTDFELIITDNASTDNTQTICQGYAARDGRIRYYRNTENLGASGNYNRAFELARGEYFKWAAHDDLLAPQFLEKTVAVLDANPDVVLCYGLTEAIDGNGNILRLYPAKPDAADPEPSKRFYEFVCVPHPCVSVFGLIRTNVLRQTRLIGNYTGSDRPLLSELSLRGRFYEIPEVLFYYRNHADQSWGENASHHSQQAWYDPHRAGKITFPHWRLLGEHLRSIRRAPLRFNDQVKCYLCMGWWARLHWKYLANNLIVRDVKYS
ncbi:MAG: glycosyltransferase family 2 protein [Anaerolineales bacterium]|nr:glycosyltransferase family 2 protein [Anaerolineales bacterium]